MTEIVLPASDRAQAAYEKARDQWKLAMEGVPAFLRCRLNLHQIQSVPEVDAEQRRLMSDLKIKHKADSVAGSLGFREGRLVYTMDINGAQRG